MPIYEYRCESCGHELEVIQKISDAPLVDCPQCAASRLRKKISAVAFRLKGSGWYETDFKSGQQRNLAAGDGESGKDQATGESGKASEATSGGDGGDVGKDAKKNAKTTEKAASSGKADSGATKTASAAASE